MFGLFGIRRIKRRHFLNISSRTFITDRHGNTPKGIYGQYLSRFSVIILGLFAGHTVVHNILQPDLSIPTIQVQETEKNEKK